MKIFCRFRNQHDIDVLNERLGIKLCKEHKYYNLDTDVSTSKKQSKKKQSLEINMNDYHWYDMPYYESKKTIDFAKIEIETKQGIDLLSIAFEQNITEKTRSIWYPKLEKSPHIQQRVVGGEYIRRVPIYVVSKNRSDKCYTSKFLSQMEVKHYVVVEPQQVDEYKANLNNQYVKVLELDTSYQDNYDTFDNLGRTKSIGPGAARNFCWEHSISIGAKWHWVMDDNAVEGFHYMYKNKKIKMRTGSFFNAIEYFVNKFDNIAIAGLNYSMFCKASDKTPPYVLNTRIYSFLLIRNDIPYRWRGRYNEDTDLSLRVLKDGWCTIQFNAFLAGKATTQKVQGGNTEEFYKNEGTLSKSKMLEDMHPDVAKVVFKFHREHHFVDYSGFKQELRLKNKYKGLTNNFNQHGMVIIQTEETQTDDSKGYLENKYSNLIKINTI